MQNKYYSSTTLAPLLVSAAQHTPSRVLCLRNPQPCSSGSVFRLAHYYASHLYSQLTCKLPESKGVYLLTGLPPSTYLHIDASFHPLHIPFILFITIRHCLNSPSSARRVCSPCSLLSIKPHNYKNLFATRFAFNLPYLVYLKSTSTFSTQHI